QSSRDALAVVEAIDAHEQPLRGRAKLERFGMDFGGVAASREIRRIDTHGIDAESDAASLVRHVFARVHLQAEQPSQRPRAVSTISARVKSYDIGAEYPLHQPLPNGEGEEDFGIWKRDVEEESNPRFGNPLAKERGHAQQLIVVHPHDIAGSPPLGDGVGETL